MSEDDYVSTRFRDRREAGRLLAEHLDWLSIEPNLVVLALPRGGVPVAYEVARALQAPLDILIVRKLGVPCDEELAMGAIASGGVRIVNSEVTEGYGVTEETFLREEEHESAELIRREETYRGKRSPLETDGKTVILVDDGIATGSTIRAAIASLRQRGVHRLILAIPVAPLVVISDLRNQVEQIVCLLTPEDFGAIGWWYEDFSQTTDGEVMALLDASSSW